jgi:hypothetical protein
MRVAIFALVSGVAVGSIAAVASCHPPPAPKGSPFDVYVPMPAEGGDAGESVDGGGGGFELGQVDRAGRPLVSVLLVGGGVLQDEYNAQPSFAAAQPRAIQDAINTRLVELDTLILVEGGAPDPLDWFPADAAIDGSHPLLSMFVADTLYVDTAYPCTGADGGFVASYLDIEREAVPFGPPHTHDTCGGRTPNEPVVDETLTLLVTADRDGGPAVRQGVPGPTRSATTTFPYLAPPN